MTSKPARPSLADMLPAKGLATRLEPLPTIETETSAPAPTEPSPIGAPASVVGIRTKPARTMRIPLTVKVSEPVYQRLREASFREETDKQDLVDQALDALLTKMGY